ncbi:hypothetical protein [Caballeronia sordidicola]|uniref:hypothetical protein n=1 Tax=Caballeronia sordidicola TaxID=196367 RepID=UPI001269E5E5|nr:hypothetical protein [Caballeronia sordidicola]
MRVHRGRWTRPDREQVADTLRRDPYYRHIVETCLAEAATKAKRHGFRNLDGAARLLHGELSRRGHYRLPNGWTIGTVATLRHALAGWK